MTISAAPTPARVVTKRPQGERLNLRIPRKAVMWSARRSPVPLIQVR